MEDIMHGWVNFVTFSAGVFLLILLVVCPIDDMSLSILLTLICAGGDEDLNG